MVFNIPSFIKQDKHILYNTIKITHAEFPFSFYVINSTNNYLSLSTGNIFLKRAIIMRFNFKYM
jgi:hypothetical protein